MSQGAGLPEPLVIPNSGRWIGNDGTWSTFYVHVGTPPQTFHVLPNIVGQTLYVPLDRDCERMNLSDCGGQRGVEIFQARKSLGYQKNASTTWNEVGTYRMGLGANLGLTGNAYYGYDSFGFGPMPSSENIELEKLPVAAYVTPDLWIGQLGLSSSPIIMGEKDKPESLLARLKQEGRIPSLSFGYQAGSPYRFTKVIGSLVFGGYDRSRQSKTLTIPSTLDTIVGVQGITSKFTNGTTTNLLDSGIIATIDTNTQDVWLPASVCDRFASAFGLRYFPDADRYIVSDTTRAALQASSPTLTFTIGTSASGGNTITIDIPYAAFDLQAKYPIFGTPTYYFPLKRAANETQFTLGRAFLQEVYLSVDWERDIFNISQATFNSPPLAQELVTIEPVNKTKPLVPRPGQPASISKKLSTGAIAGIAIGVIAIILLVVGLVWWLYRRKQNAKKEEQTSQTLPIDEKQDAELGVNPVTKPPVESRTDLELEGLMMVEMYAPHGDHEMYGGNKPPDHATQIVEADSTTPIYELASPTHELPTSKHHTHRGNVGVI
ncbi:acid protease [Ophiobolus disseminans]|uniref:Acid protease n=1 Tax=Ophiobolus disseminans TaxID=1469910 RepID=A0A6A7ADW2_9PLEO|nr:acid protease [Ophiobolus disseminans]